MQNALAPACRHSNLPKATRCVPPSPLLKSSPTTTTPNPKVSRPQSFQKFRKKMKLKLHPHVNKRHLRFSALFCKPRFARAPPTPPPRLPRRPNSHAALLCSALLCSALRRMPCSAFACALQLPMPLQLPMRAAAADPAASFFCRPLCIIAITKLAAQQALNSPYAPAVHHHTPHLPPPLTCPLHRFCTPALPPTLTMPLAMPALTLMSPCAPIALQSPGAPPLLATALSTPSVLQCMLLLRARPHSARSPSCIAMPALTLMSPCAPIALQSPGPPPLLATALRTPSVLHCTPACCACLPPTLSTLTIMPCHARSHSHVPMRPHCTPPQYRFGLLCCV